MSVMSIQQRSLNFREINGNKLNCHERLCNVPLSISRQCLSLLSYFFQYALHPPNLFLKSRISSTVFFIYLICTSSRPPFSSPLISSSSSLLLSSRPLFSSHLLHVFSSPLISSSSSLLLSSLTLSFPFLNLSHQLKLLLYT